MNTEMSREWEKQYEKLVNLNADLLDLVRKNMEMKDVHYANKTISDGYGGVFSGDMHSVNIKNNFVGGTYRVDYSAKPVSGSGGHKTSCSLYINDKSFRIGTSGFVIAEIPSGVNTIKLSIATASRDDNYLLVSKIK